jgi:hypothetical protein
MVDGVLTNIAEVFEIEETGGSLGYNDLTALKVSAELPYVGNFDIGNDYLRIYSLSSLGEEGSADYRAQEILHGTFLCSRPQTDYTGATASGTVECYSLLKLLEDTALEEPLTLGEGADPVGEATLLIASVGLASVADVSSTLTTSARSYDAGTSYLEVCNDLMGVAGFDTLEIDASGTVRLMRYVDPASLEPRWVLRDDAPDVVFGPEVTQELDTFDVPNRVIAVKSASGDEVPLTAVAVNDDPTSIYSTVSRGRVITYVDTVSDLGLKKPEVAEGEEAEEPSTEEILAALKAIAERTLTTKSSAVESVELAHPYLPYNTGDALRLVYTKHDLDFTGVAVSKTLELKSGMPTKCRLRRFVRR